MKNNQSIHIKSSHKSHKMFWVTTVVIVLAIAGATIALYVHNKNKGHEAKTTSTAQSAQNNYQSKDTKHQPQPSSGNAQGGAVDNKGDTGATTPSPSQTNSTTSPSGVLTVLGLANNSLVQTGDVLHGTVTDKTITQIQFRVVDDTVGVVAQGQLAVINGNYSGTLSFTSRGSTGRVDVYNFDAMSSETNNVTILVRFK